MNKKQCTLLSYWSIRITYLFFLLIILIENHNIFNLLKFYLFDKKYLFIMSYILTIINTILVIAFIYKKTYVIKRKLLLYFEVSNFIIAFNIISESSLYLLLSYCIIYSMIYLLIIKHKKNHISRTKWIILYIIFSTISFFAFCQFILVEIQVYQTLHYDFSNTIQFIVFPILKTALFILLFNFIFIKTKEIDK